MRLRAGIITLLLSLLLPVVAAAQIPCRGVNTGSSDQSCWLIGGTFTPNASPGASLVVTQTLKAEEAAQALASVRIAPTLAEYVAGAAPAYFAALHVSFPTITAGSATDPTIGAALFVAAEGTGATANYGIYSAGAVKFHTTMVVDGISTQTGAVALNGGATVATAQTLAVTDADKLTVGGVIVPQSVEVSFHAGAAALMVDQSFFVATQAYTVTKVSYVSAVAETTAATMRVQVTKDTSTNAPGAGIDLLTNTSNAGFDNKAAANTVQVGTLSVTASDLILAVGDRLSVDFTVAATELVGVTITVTLKRS